MANLTNANRPEASQPNEGGVDFEAASMGGRSRFGAAGMVAAAALALGGATSQSEGSLMRTMANDPLHRSLGQSYLMGGSALANTGGAAGSLQIAVDGGGIRLASGGFWNSEYFITAAHNLEGIGPITPGQITVATGANAINNRGITRTVLEIIPSPWGVGSNPNLPDIVALRFAPIQGINQALVRSSPVGLMLTHNGNGNYGDPVVGEIFTDGNIRGFNAPVDSFITNGYNPNYYYQTRFDSNVLDPLNGQGRNIDSGGIVVTPDGYWTAIMTARTLGIGDGATFSTRLDPPEVQAYLATLPAPGTAAVLGMAAAYFSRRRRS